MKLTFEVRAAATATAGTRYINVLLDQNHDGVWKDGGALPSGSSRTSP